MGQQWEYCQLKFSVRVPVSAEVAPELLLTFAGPAGITNYPLLNQSWLAMFGLLGTLEWELVSAGSTVAGDVTSYAAYFKRPQQPGRAIDDMLANLVGRH